MLGFLSTATAPALGQHHQHLFQQQEQHFGTSSLAAQHSRAGLAWPTQGAASPHQIGDQTRGYCCTQPGFPPSFPEQARSTECTAGAQRHTEHHNPRAQGLPLDLVITLRIALLTSSSHTA